MILTHESGAQEDQFDEKKEGPKSRETIPLKPLQDKQGWADKTRPSKMYTEYKKTFFKFPLFGVVCRIRIWIAT